MRLPHCFSLLLISLWAGCSTNPPEESQRFAHTAPVAEFRAPAYREHDADFEYFKHLIDSTGILPFEYRLDGIFFMSGDRDNLYVSLGPSAQTAANSPEQAALRKPYLGVTAFDLRTGKVRWHKNYREDCTFPVTDSVFSIGYPYRFKDCLVVVKSDWNTRAVCYNILDAATGKLLGMGGLARGSFPVLDMQYWLAYDDDQHRVQRLDPASGTALWTYNFPAHDYAFDDQLRSLNQQILYYSYRKADVPCFDFIDAATGKVLHTLSFSPKALNGAIIHPCGYEQGTAYFNVSVCGRLKLDATRNCLGYDVACNPADMTILRRTAYREGR